MKEFLSIFFHNLIPTREFIMNILTGVVIAITMAIPLGLYIEYGPHPYNSFVLLMLFYAEFYVLMVGIKSWMEYTRRK